MKLTNFKKLKNKKLVVFDLDGTLAETKSIMDREMSDLIAKLLTVKKVAVIGGGKYKLFQEQLIDQFTAPKELLRHMYLFPTTSTAFYRFNKDWKKVYSHQLSVVQRKKIKKTFDRVLKEAGFIFPKKAYGPIIEDRGTQVTFSALGQDIAKVLGKKGVRLKEKWLKENKPMKMKIAKLMSKYLPQFEVRAAGFTSIDVTKKGIDKAYGLKQIEKYLHIKIKDMLFVGDAIFPGGNDYAVTKTPVDYLPVKGPEETKKIIRQVLAK